MAMTEKLLERIEALEVWAREGELCGLYPFKYLPLRDGQVEKGRVRRISGK